MNYLYHEFVFYLHSDTFLFHTQYLLWFNFLRAIETALRTALCQLKKQKKKKKTHQQYKDRPIKQIIS